MELEFRHLRIVITVADEGSITRAAAVLGLSQPSLTSQLQRIERALGAPLFERAHTGVVPTSFGRTVLAKARAVISEMAHLRDTAVAARPAADRPVLLRLGSYPGSLLSVVVPRLAEVFAVDHPALRVQAHSDPSTADLLARVRAGRLDAAIVVEHLGFELPTPEGVLREVVIPVEPRFVALSDGHRLAARTEVDLADLAEENWVVDPQRDHGAVSALRHACRVAGFAPRITHEITDAGVAREFVSSGQCVCLAQPTSSEGRGVVVRPLVGDPVRCRVDLAWHRDCPVDPVPVRRAVAGSYLELIDRNGSYRRWWAEHGVALS